MNVPPARVTFPPDVRHQALVMIDEALRTGVLTLGPLTSRLEEEFAARHHAAHAVAVSSGTAALEIIFRCLGVAGREVIVPANTFFATAAAVLHAGGRPRLADVDPATLALSAASVEAALTAETAGVVMVHIGGLISPDVEAVRRLCEERGLFFVEDAAHAHGASFAGRMAGSFGVASAFSFYPTKVVTGGEGGMIVTADEGLRDEARVYRDQGKASFLGGDHVRLGSAWRMSELHAAVVLAHLTRLDDFIAVRRTVADRYDAAAWDGAAPLPRASGGRSNFYKYPVLLRPGTDRPELKQRLRARGVGLSGEVYPVPLHREPVFRHLSRAGLAAAEDVCARHICLPIHSDMTDKEVTYVLTCLQDVLEGLDEAEAVAP